MQGIKDREIPLRSYRLWHQQRIPRVPGMLRNSLQLQIKKKSTSRSLKILKRQKNEIEHFDSYEVIYLGYPIWWGTTPMIINTLLESYDFSGKTVVPYATSGGTGIGQSISDIRSEIPDADVY